eukprot:scaffold220_cov169-Amphora_coffeaeformis.AAC.17
MINDKNLTTSSAKEWLHLAQVKETTPLTSFASSVSMDDERSELFKSNHSMVSFSSSGYVLYPQRWLVLTAYCLVNLSNGWTCVVWSPLTAALSEYWQVPERTVDALGGVYLYVFVPTNVVAMWLVMNALGLARGLQVGALLNTIGLAIMCQQPVYPDDDDDSAFVWFDARVWTDYQIKYLGMFLCALAQAFVLPMITLLSSSWFGEEERATSTSVGALCFQFGSLLGLASTVVVDFQDHTTGAALDPRKLQDYLWWQWVVSFVAFGAVCLMIRDRPPTPPSLATATLLQQDKVVAVKYLDSIRMVVASPGSRAFFFLFGLAVGIFYAIPVFLSQFMPSWPARHQGILGGIFQIAAVLGCFAGGQFVEWYELQYKKISLLLLVGCLLASVLYYISVQYQSYLGMVACACMGFFYASFMSVGIEFGTALTFPADEAAVYGILDSTGELFGFAMVTLGGYMSHAGMDAAFCGALTLMVAIALMILWRLEPLIRRPSQFSASSSCSVGFDDARSTPVGYFFTA